MKDTEKKSELILVNVHGNILPMTREEYLDFVQDYAEMMKDMMN